MLQMVETEVLPRSHGWYATWPRKLIEDPKALYSLTRLRKLTLLICNMHNWCIISLDAQLPSTHGFEERFVSVTEQNSVQTCQSVWKAQILIYTSYLLYGQDLKGNEGREGRKAAAWGWYEKLLSQMTWGRPGTAATRGVSSGFFLPPSSLPRPRILTSLQAFRGSSCVRSRIWPTPSPTVTWIASGSPGLV